ncbi:hypothetical protein G9A89_009639 [Geosiphon pyriformis]|nr:hypothetical protein G9A89_009639 [Geosiphon pyriformis]
MPWHSLCFLVTLPINPLNCFLAGATQILASCKISLGGAFSNVFWTGTNVLILDMLGLDGYLDIRKFLMKYGLIFANQLLDYCGICFTWNTFRRWKKLNLRVNVVSYSAPTDFFCDVGFTSEHLLALNHESIEVYTNGSVKNLGSIGACGGTAAYFPRANANIAITLALNCVSISSIVELFTDSQMSLDICKFNIGMSVSNFYCKSDFFANATVFSKFMLPLNMPYYFFRIENRFVSGNTCHFVKNLFDAVNFVNIVETGDAGKIDTHKLFSVWHSDVTMRKRLYNSRYLSIICIRCDMVEDSDHLFLCLHDDNTKKTVLFFIRERWCKVAGNSAIRDRVVHSLREAKLSYSLYILLAKGLAECHRSDIWLPAAKLRAFYEKHNLLPCDGSVVSSITSLSNFWTVDVVHGLGIRLDPVSA